MKVLVFEFESIGHGEETPVLVGRENGSLGSFSTTISSPNAIRRGPARGEVTARVFIGMETIPAARDIYPMRLRAGGGNSSKLPQLLSRLIEVYGDRWR